MTQFDDIDGIVWQRDGLDLAFEKLDIFDAGFLLVLSGERQHVVGHIEAVSLAGWADPPRRKKNIDAAARAKIKDDLARLQLGQRRGIAAAKRGKHRRFGQHAFFGHVVEIGDDGTRTLKRIAAPPQHDLPLLTRCAAWL
jgi:hypothetical protein